MSHLPTPTAESFAHLPLRILVASLTNPRTTFNAAKLQELADSIRGSGVHQPILVRPLPGTRVGDTERQVEYEIVAGERRFRACQMAEVATIPAMVRAMSDAAVLEVQIVENLQRDDLSELEEAEGYDRLMQHSSLTAEAVGAKIGKSRSYVYARLKLLDLSFECKAALREGLMDSSRALLIARIPDSKLQIKALEYATELHNGEAVSVRAFQVWLQQNVMLPLERAPFQITDARLVESAGSCKDCPKRTGANPDIFTDVASADICTDPPCYNAKAEVHHLRCLAKAEAKGMRLIIGSEAKTICYPDSSALKNYSPLSQFRADAGGERLDQLLGKDFEGAVLIENPWTHELIEAVPTAEAEGVLLAKGLVKAAAPAMVKAETADAEIAKIKKSVEREVETRFRVAAYSVISAAINNTPDAMASALITPALLRAWLTSLVELVSADALAEVVRMTLDQPRAEQAEALRLHIRAIDNAALFRAAALFMLDDDREAYYFGQDAKPVPLFAVAAADKCIDLASLRAEVVKEVKAETSVQIADLKVQIKAQKQPPPKPPLAQPVDAPDAAAKTPLARAKPTRGPVSRRLSAEEAKLGIAEAMQGIEAEPVPGSGAVDDDLVQAGELGLQVNGLSAGQGLLSVGVMVGQRVKVLGNVPQGRTQWIGKTGTVVAKVGDRAWDVSFLGRNGGLASFDETELAVVS